MTAVVISHYNCRRHKVPDWHVESPERLDAINNQLLSSGLDYVVRHIDAPHATKRQLERVHCPEYLASLEAQVPETGVNNLDDDICFSPKTLVAAQHAAGANAYAVQLIMDGETDTVFCNVRPPGHHAERKKAMGFCFYNNIAVAAAHALEEYGLKRVAIVDFDVHHGNGTQDIFLDDDRVLFCSAFQDPLYPETDKTPNRNHIINVSLPAETKSADYKVAVEQAWFKRLRDFKPELLLISAGFDAHAEDDISGICLVENDYKWLTEQLKAIVEQTPECRGIVSTLEGGYNLSALARSVVAHIKALAKL